jgi:hypothetical protein
VVNHQVEEEQVVAVVLARQENPLLHQEVMVVLVHI